MTSRFASLVSLASVLVVVSSCSSTDDVSFGTIGNRGGTSGDTDQPGKGGGAGAGADPTTGFGGTGGSTAPGASGAAGSGPSPGSGGAAGDTDGGFGAGGNSESSGQDCPKDTGGPTGVDCGDENQVCVCPEGQACDAVCAGAQPLGSNQTCREFLLVGRPVGKQPACALQPKVGPSMGFSFLASSTGWARFTVTPTQGDVIVSATTAGCDQVTAVSKTGVCRNEVGAGGAETVLVPVTVGQVVSLLVTGATAQDASARFDVRTELLLPECGNGLLDEGEVCDDGKASKACGPTCTSFLGCQDASALADASGTSLEPTVASATLGDGTGASLSSCVTVGAAVHRTIYALRAANTGQLEARLASPGGSDLALSVRRTCESSQELACSDRQGEASGATEERLSLPATAGETYYLVVEGYGESAASYELSARTLPVVCGDGIVVPSVEQCDPGGVTVDTTCEKTCTRASAAGDDAKAPVVLTTGKPVEARILPAGDVDEYMVTAEGPVTVSVADVNTTDCAAGKLDSQLTVLNLQGQVVAFNDDAETGGSVQGYCSEVTLPKGSYRVRVRSSEASAPSQVFSYRVLVASAKTP